MKLSTEDLCCLLSYNHDAYIDASHDINTLASKWAIQ